MITGYNLCMRNINVKFRGKNGPEYTVVEAASADDDVVRAAFAASNPGAFVISMEDRGEVPAPPVKPPKAEKPVVEKP